MYLRHWISHSGSFEGTFISRISCLIYDSVLSFTAHTSPPHPPCNASNSTCLSIQGISLTTKIWSCILLQRCTLLLIHPWFLSTGFSGRYAEASSQMLLFLLLAKTNSASNAPNQFVLVYSLSSRSLLQRHSFLQLMFCQLQWLFIGLLTRQIMDFIFPVEQGAIRPTFLSLFCFWAATWWLLQLSSLFECIKFFTRKAGLESA